VEAEAIGVEVELVAEAVDEIAASTSLLETISVNIHKNGGIF